MQNVVNEVVVSPFAKVRECPETGYKSLYAEIAFERGEVISSFHARETFDRPSYLTLQISDLQHINIDPEFLQYINHSCNPNVFFDTIAMQVIALRNIKIGEEFSFFYPSTEWAMDRGFDCICQSENCLEFIQGAAYISPSILLDYKLSPHIRKKLTV
ncbi:MAG: SET domain-containing protein [Cyanobacteria bacterium SBLK]|nr:SET domain-containing protein [Cyanobacteria bacterium SBLK]